MSTRFTSPPYPVRLCALPACLLALVAILGIAASPAVAQEDLDQLVDAIGGSPADDATGADAPAIQQGLSSRERAARMFGRFAGHLVRRADLDAEDLVVALDFIRLANELYPEDPTLWRMQVQLATANDASDPAVLAARVEALDRLVALDPGDESIRLQRLVSIVEREGTVEARQARLERMLDPALRDRIGEAVAARLAFDLAVLLSRSGDFDGQRRWLMESLALNPSSPSATLFAAGLLRPLAPDRLAEAELLAAAALADPLNIEAIQEFGYVLLDGAAFRGAGRFLRLAFGSMAARGASGDALATDAALALWGARRPKDGLQIIEQRRRELDGIYRELILRSNPDADQVALLRTRSPVPPNLAMINATILVASEDDATYRAFVQQASKGIRSFAESIAADPADPEQVVTYLLESAVFFAWHAGEPDLVRDLVARADAILPLSDDAKERFEGLALLAADQYDAALERLEPLAERDTAAAFGASLAHERAGRVREAARIWLDIWRNLPGTLFGLASRTKLEEAIDRRVEPDGDEAPLLEGLARGVPRSFDRMVSGDEFGYVLRVEPSVPTFGPYEPVIVMIEIANRSNLPIAISETGPLRRDVAIELDLGLDGGARRASAMTMFIPIDRRLVLPARSQLTIPVDLALGQAGDLLAESALLGGTISARVITNHVAAGGNFKMVPGPLGVSVTTPFARVEGAPIDLRWMRSTLAQLEAVRSPEEATPPATLARFALLLEALALGERRVDLDGTSSDVETVGNARVTKELIASLAGRLFADDPDQPDEQTSIARLVALCVETFDRLDPAAQAWITARIPVNVARLRPIEERIIASREPLVLAALLTRAVASSDPVLDHVANVGDEDMRRLAERVRAAIPTFEQGALAP